MKKAEPLFETGKRRRAVARGYAKPGSGRVIINGVPLEVYGNELVRMIISEPLIMGGDVHKKTDIYINVQGGGLFGQADAIRQVIAKILVKLDSSLKEKFLNYDRSLLIADPRRTEPHKPSRSKQGPRRHKQRSKR